jgi:hypothetical protein
MFVHMGQTPTSTAKNQRVEVKIDLPLQNTTIIVLVSQTNCLIKQNKINKKIIFFKGLQ